MLVEKTHEDGKMEVGYARGNGQMGSKFEIYNNIDALARDVQQVKQLGDFSLKKQLFPSQGV